MQVQMQIFFKILWAIHLFVKILNKETMKNAVLQRIKELFEIKGFNSERKLAEAVGLNQKTLNQQLNGQRALSLDTVLAILSSFEDLSAEWLLRGKGEVLDEDNMKNAFGDFMTELQELNVKYSMLQKMYDEKCAEVAALKKR